MTTFRSARFPFRCETGVRIAVDLVLPDPLPESGKLPAILTMTRYWRSFEGDGASAVQRFFATRGYAVITGDSRGTGASFGILAVSSRARRDQGLRRDRGLDHRTAVVEQRGRRLRHILYREHRGLVVAKQTIPP